MPRYLFIYYNISFDSLLVFSIIFSSGNKEKKNQTLKFGIWKDDSNRKKESEKKAN